MALLVVLILVALYKIPKLIRERQWNKLAIYSVFVVLGLVLLIMLAVQIYKIT